MNKMGWLGRATIGSLLVAALVGCNAPQVEPLNGEQRQAIESEVAAFLLHYREAFNARDTEAIAGLYVTDERFALYEDGTLRYPEPQAILDALASFPAGMSMTTEGSIAEITPLTAELATASTTYRTQMTMPGGASFTVEGVMTALLERSPDGWRLVQAHTSSVRQRQESGDYGG
jgi:ketosteroid isomerase-like protein